MKKVVAIVVLILITAGAFGQDKTLGTGQWLHDLWVVYQKDVRGESFRAGFYLGFVQGIMMGSMGSEGNETIFCIPDGVTVGQICAIIGKYLDGHPEEWDRGAYHLIIETMARTYPPKK